MTFQARFERQLLARFDDTHARDDSPFERHAVSEGYPMPKAERESLNRHRRALREILDLTASGNPDALEVMLDIQTVCREALGDA